MYLCRCTNVGSNFESKKMKEIIEYILKNYLDGVKPNIKSHFQDWVISLSEYDQDSKRLLICLAIDTKFKLVSKSDYIQIFNNIDYSVKAKPQICFHNACEKENAKYHFFSEIKDKENSFEYSSIVKLWIFTESYLKSYYKADDYNFIEDQLLNDEIIDLKVSFDFEKDIRPNKVFWVTIKDVIDKLLLKAESEKINKANLICSKLGLSWKHMGTIYDPNPDRVIVNYQNNIPEYFHQPISANADWKSEGGLFLSYKKLDGFGRTRCTNDDGTCLGVKERVHKEFGNSYSITAKYLGKTEKLQKNTNEIIETAKDRFNG